MKDASVSISTGRGLRSEVTTRVLRLGVTLGIIVGVLSACADLVSPKHVDSDVIFHSGVRHELSCPSGLSELLCNQLQAAITQLKNSTDGFCVALGTTVESRFNNNQLVYDPYTPYWGYVFTNMPLIFLGPSAFDAGELANTLAHEESHLSLGYEDLQNGAPNDAWAAGDRCAGLY